MSKIQITQYQRGCVHDIDHVTMSMLPEGTKLETNNQWFLTCTYGPTWVWHDPSATWLPFSGNIKLTDVELPFERAYELLQSIKARKQIE